MNDKVLTEQMFLEGRFKVEEPEILSRRNKRYFEKHARRLTPSNVQSLCEILQYPASEIFKDEHMFPIKHYGTITLDGKEYSIESSRVRNILLEIKAGRLDKNDVLHDISKLLSKHKPEKLSLKVKVYNNLISAGYMRLKY